MCERFLLENNKFGENQAMGEINGAVAIYLMLNICLTAKTICAIDLSNNISHQIHRVKNRMCRQRKGRKCKKPVLCY